MIIRKVVRLSALGLFFTFLAATASAQTPYGSFTQLEYHEIPFTPDSGDDVEGFCYGGGYIWVISWYGKLIKIDPAGSIVSAIDILTTNCHGAICYDDGTLWVVSSQGRILPFDTDGNSLGSGIDISGLPDPFSGSSWPIWGMVKDGDGFWLDSYWVPMIFKVDMSGTVVKQFPNSWLDHDQATFAKLGNKIYKLTYNYTPSNSYSRYEAIGIDADTGSVTDSWTYPNTFPRPLGLSLGDGCFWALTYYVFDGFFRIRRLSIPDPSPVPGLPSTQWGDFTITGWSYPPMQPPQIGGLVGFGYDRNNDRFWLGAGYEQLWGITDVDTPISPIYGYWDSHFDAQPGDIAFYGDQMWILESWSSASTDLVARVQIVDGVLQFIEEWPTGMRQAAGLATNGTHFWVSGHIDFHTTADLMDTIRKFDLAGNLIAEWTYAAPTNYEDLTWHRGGLWAINMISSSSCEIHKIDIDTGAVLATYQTGWHGDPSDFTTGTLASNGDTLLTFAALTSGGTEVYQESHLRLIEIQLPSDRIRTDFNGDGQEDILWRYYGEGGYNRAWFLGDSEAAGLSLQTANMQIAAAPAGSRSIGKKVPGTDIRMAQVSRSMPAGKDGQAMKGVQNPMAGMNRRGSRAAMVNDPRQAGGGRYQAARTRVADPRQVKLALDPAGAPVKIAAAPVYLGGGDVMAVGDLNWQIVGTGDFDNDTHVDILWRNIYTGTNVIWLMDGTEWSSSVEILPVGDQTWQIVGTGDFNNDTHVDILWRNVSDGMNVVWYMNGVTWSSSAVLLGVSDPNWQIVGTGDFNNDTYVDILWRYNGAGGYNVVWHMDGAAWSSSAELMPVGDTSWMIMGTADYDKDGDIDILWRYNGAGGYNVIWYMNGVTWSSSAELIPVADLNWKIVSR